MAEVADRVKETTTTTGTGTYSLGGAATGFRTFVAGIGTGLACYYCVTDGVDWEVGVGTITDATPDTPSRTTILASSNANAAVNWGAGSKDVFVTMPAAALGAETRTASVQTGSFTTNTTYVTKWRRIGDSLHARTTLAFAGAPNSVTCTIDLPDSLTADTSKLPSGFVMVGRGRLDDPGGLNYCIQVALVSGVLHLFVELASGTYVSLGGAQAVTQALPVTLGSGDSIEIEYIVPISGW